MILYCEKYLPFALFWASPPPLHVISESIYVRCECDPIRLHSGKDSLLAIDEWCVFTFHGTPFCRRWRYLNRPVCIASSIPSSARKVHPTNLGAVELSDNLSSWRRLTRNNVRKRCTVSVCGEVQEMCTWDYSLRRRGVPRNSMRLVLRGWRGGSIQYMAICLHIRREYAVSERGRRRVVDGVTTCPWNNFSICTSMWWWIQWVTLPGKFIISSKFLLYVNKKTEQKN